MENYIELRIKCLRFDNGGKYDKTEFKKLNADSGIRLIRLVRGKKV